MKRIDDLKRFPEFDNHEAVFEAEDPESGLHAFIAIHNTNLGPATGGTRFFSYKSRDDAIADALRLSEAMTYKCALAGVNYGGGKGIIVGNPEKIKTDALLKSYADAVNRLGGRFTTGEDVGLTNDDIMVLSSESEYINGRPRGAGELAPWAALGVLYAMQTALEFRFGSSQIAGHLFAVKGLGKVGSVLCRLLHEQGGEIIAADINPKAIESAKQTVSGLSTVNPEEIHRQRVDVYAPCALGGDFNKETISELNCSIVCGAANSQLVSADTGQYFIENNIVYVPDYVANAGGLINIASEMNENGYNREDVAEKVRAIGKKVMKILELSRESGKPTNEVANKLAEQIFNHAKR